MSMHDYLMANKDYHFIQKEHNGIKYAYISNIDYEYDNILAIIKHTLPFEIVKEFQNNHSCYSTIYIWVGHENQVKDRYYIIISLAQDNLQASQREIYRVFSKDIDTCVNKYMKIIHTDRFIKNVINGLKGGAVTLPIREFD